MARLPRAGWLAIGSIVAAVALGDALDAVPGLAVGILVLGVATLGTAVVLGRRDRMRTAALLVGAGSVALRIVRAARGRPAGSRDGHIR